MLEQRRPVLRLSQKREDIAHYLEAAFEDGDPMLLSAVLRNAARAKGISRTAKAAGVNRERLLKALSPPANPGLATVLKVVRALGLKLTLTV